MDTHTQVVAVFFLLIAAVGLAATAVIHAIGKPSVVEDERVGLARKGVDVCRK
jgi:hypothetical protein